MKLHGCNIIGKELSAEDSRTFGALNPETGEEIAPGFHAATPVEVDRAVSLADAAFPIYRRIAVEQRASFLDYAAEELLSLGDALIERAQMETALPRARLIGERTRTINQLRMFAAVIREGSWVEARIDHALPDRKPAPRPDLRRMLIPLGPVGVFGASNFPLAYSVPGGDTASALAAGCPVVVKAHPAHPGTSELAASAIAAAAAATGMPDGVFSLIHGWEEAGLRLVKHPLLQAVGFTGSLAGGRSLFDAAAARPRPIPVYAEMGSVNPVFLLPGALAERGAVLAAGLADSVVLGVGQFCTNPGLLIALACEGLRPFVDDLAERLAKAAPGVMLHPGICKAYHAGLEELVSTPGVQVESRAENKESRGSAALLSTGGAAFLANPDLARERFGPSTLLVVCSDAGELMQVAAALEGQLTASIHASAEELEQFPDLVSLLATKAGRLVHNGYPTGVEVSPAMQHGGPYPASADARTTSVGSAAIGRFARPVCFQDFPAALLPVELQDGNPREIWRLVDGEWGK